MKLATRCPASLRGSAYVNRNIEIMLALLISALLVVTHEIMMTSKQYAERPVEVYIPLPQFGTLAPDCGHLYNDDTHAEWSACMGVGYKLKRNDI